VRKEHQPNAIYCKMMEHVAVDCIALNYWGKHKRKLTSRGIN